MEHLTYISTRGNNQRVTASQAILQGIADDGGLFVPSFFPVIEEPPETLAAMTYQQLAVHIFKHFLTDYTMSEIEQCVANAYDHKFEYPAIAPVVSKGGAHFLELFHGPTLAFKDMALSILPHLMKTAAVKNNLHKKIIILVSTSGDTGKAALNGFADVPGTGIMVLYPKGKVSLVQELQMTTQKGANTHVLGINGNFDDCQSVMKDILVNPSVAEALEANNAVFSSANSINIGRLLPQIVYYYYAYGQMIKKGEITAGQPLNFTVPSGNFGNILAGFYAKQTGLPVGRLICASNSNSVLYDFFQTGVYDKQRPFITTMSPSMDILISSNLERLLYHLSGDPEKIKALMTQLSSEGHYQFDIPISDFFGAFVTETETLDAIAQLYAQGYTMDTHTAVAYTAFEKYKAQTGDQTSNVIVSTASPFKFAADVCRGIDVNHPENTNLSDVENMFDMVRKLSLLSGLPVPENIKDLDKQRILHRHFCEKEAVIGYVIKFIELCC